MKIVLVSQEYPPETAHGGIATQTYLKAHGLASLGHDVVVISHSLRGERCEYSQGKVRVIRIPSGVELISYTEPAQWLSRSFAVATEISKLEDIDLIDFPEWGCEGYLHLINETEWNHIPSVIQLHGPLVMFAHSMGWPEIDSEFYRVGRSMEETCLRLADSVYSSSACSIDWCTSHYGLDRRDIPVIHAGIDTTLFRPVQGPKAERPTIIFVGKIERNKGVRLLMDAAILLAKEFDGLHLKMIGRGNPSLIAELQTIARDAGLPDLLTMAGQLKQEELPYELSRAHVFAAPSIYEGGPGFVYLEAMACALPVVGCAGSGSSEVIEHERTGLLVAPNDLEWLTHALRRLLLDPEEAAAMGTRGRRYVEQHADKKDCIRRLESFYESVVERRKPQMLLANA